jgi:hypothetical protein
MTKRKALRTYRFIAEFVDRVNGLPREPGNADEIPPSVRANEGADGWYDWRIRPWPDVNWIEPVDLRLGAVLPRSFRFLLTHYVFPTFEAGPLLIWGTTPDGAPDEFRERVFLDPAFDEVLLAASLIPFANPETGSYDPLCFDTR